MRQDPLDTIKAVRPNQVWETDIIYIWCDLVDGGGYRFNVLDIFR